MTAPECLLRGYSLQKSRDLPQQEGTSSGSRSPQHSSPKSGRAPGQVECFLFWAYKPTWEAATDFDTAQSWSPPVDRVHTVRGPFAYPPPHVRPSHRTG